MKNQAAAITRRQLVKTASLVPFASVAGSAANSAVTVGLFGSGKRGSTVSRLLVQNTNARIVALCDLYDEQIELAKKKIGLKDPKIYKDYHDLLASDVDAVIIATPAFLHPEHFEAAIKSGKHIYIEKPAAPDVAGCKRIMRAADAADRKINITFGFQRRYGQVYHKAKQLVDSGAIGPIRHGHAHFVKSGSVRPPTPRPVTDAEKIKSWYPWRDLSGDLIVENNVHVIDVLNWFLGGHPVSAIGSGGRTARKDGDVRDHNHVSYDYGDGVEALLLGGTLAPRFHREVYERFMGSKGIVETASEYWKHYRDRDDVMEEKSPRNVAIDAVEQFVERIAEGKPENVGVRGAESTLTAILGRMAMDNRREVTWDEMMKS